MASGDFNPDDMFDWDDDDDDIEVRAETLSEEEMDEVDKVWTFHRQRQIESFVRVAYEDNGIVAMTELLLAIERNTNWRVEIIADKAGLEAMTFHVYSGFDPLIWESFINSDSYHEMVHQVAAVANRSARDFVEAFLGVRKRRRKLRAFIRRLKRLYQ